MQDWADELERRRSMRHRHATECELLLEGRTHAATVVDLSQGGVYLQSDAPVWPGAMVRLRLRDYERYALVMRERQIPHRLRGLLPRGFGLRWIRSGAPD
jgi:PilZ domain-containing protein